MHRQIFSLCIWKFRIGPKQKRINIAIPSNLHGNLHVLSASAAPGPHGRWLVAQFSTPLAHPDSRCAVCYVTDVPHTSQTHYLGGKLMTLTPVVIYQEFLVTVQRWRNLLCGHKMCWAFKVWWQQDFYWQISRHRHTYSANTG